MGELEGFLREAAVVRAEELFAPDQALSQLWLLQWPHGSALWGHCQASGSPCPFWILLECHVAGQGLLPEQLLMGPKVEPRSSGELTSHGVAIDQRG